MDNLTHALIGVLISHTLIKRPALRTASTWIAVLASNLPDIDLVTRPLFEDAKLGYLVHHRGHTHTVPVALLLLPLAMWLGLTIGKLRWSKLDGEARRQLLGVGVVSVLLHMGADAWNNYGVHPFWPFWSDWIYGDFIFIIEPLLLAVMLPYALWTASSRWGRVGWSLPLLAILGLVWSQPGMPTLAALLTSGLALVSVGLQARMRSSGLALGLVLSVLSLFWWGSHTAEARLVAHHAAISPQERFVDVSLNPTPAMPICWQFVLQARSESGEVIQRLGYLSLNPGLLPSSACAFRIGNARTAVLTPLTEPTMEGMQWLGGLRLPLEPLETWAMDCRVEGLLHFIRMPYWKEEGEALVMGDLRYDYEPELGWAELKLEHGGAPSDCERYRAAWTPPALQDLRAFVQAQKLKAGADQQPGVK